MAPDLQSDGGVLIPGPPVEIDAERAVRRQPLDEADVANGIERQNNFRDIPGKRRRDSAATAPAPCRIVDAPQLLAERVDPGAHDRLDRLLQARAIGIRRVARRSDDDEMDADERAFREKRVERAHPALVDAGKIIADSLAHVAVVALARDVDEDGNEAFEAVAPRQDAHARPFVELQHRHREMVERILVDLEKLVARIILQHIHQRLSGMSLGIKAGTLEDRIDLAAQIGNGPGGARVGRGGEEADDAELANKLADGVEALHANIVHVDVTVNARTPRGLGDDEQRRLVQQRTDLGRDHERLVPALHHPHVAGSQNAEPGFEHGLEGISGWR